MHRAILLFVRLIYGCLAVSLAVGCGRSDNPSGDDMGSSEDDSGTFGTISTGDPDPTVTGDPNPTTTGNPNPTTTGPDPDPDPDPDPGDDGCVADCDKQEECFGPGHYGQCVDYCDPFMKTLEHAFGAECRAVYNEALLCQGKLTCEEYEWGGACDELFFIAEEICSLHAPTTGTCAQSCDTQLTCTNDWSSPEECWTQCAYEGSAALIFDDSACGYAFKDLQGCIGSLSCFEYEQYLDGIYGWADDYPCRDQWQHHDNICDY
jgi:hypothetical protein